MTGSMTRGSGVGFPNRRHRFGWPLVRAVAGAVAGIAAVATASPASAGTPPAATTTLALNAAALGGTEIWFGPRYPKLRALVNGEDTGDYLSLFAPNAAWQDVLPYISEFGLPGYIAAMPARDLRTLISFVNDHHIALAFGGEVLPTRPDCGFGEGYGGPNALAQITKGIEYIRQNGGTVSYFNMDEPMWYGHEAIGNGPKGHFVLDCHYTPQQVAHFAADVYRAVKAVAPAIKFVQSEVITGSDQVMKMNPNGAMFNSAEWVAAIEAYLVAFRSETGAPIYQIQADIQWQHRFQDELVPLAAFLRAHGTRLAITYNGFAFPRDPDANVTWVNTAIGHYRTVEGTLHIIPDTANFVSWNVNPEHNLPDTMPGTLTYLVRQYIQWRTGR